VFAPDAVTPVVAWRAWLVEGEDSPWRLTSVVHRCPWPVRCELVAGCMTTTGGRAHDHFSPRERCRCGIYGASRIETLLSYVGYPYTPDKRPRVIGLVNLWGRVYEHQQGWRASHAYPLRLWLPILGPSGQALERWQEIALDLADYGVPVDTVECTDAESLLRASMRQWERLQGEERRAA
jgi:hypothetical protein